MCMVGIWLCHIPSLHHDVRIPLGWNLTGGNMLGNRAISGAYCQQWTTISGATCICEAVFSDESLRLYSRHGWCKTSDVYLDKWLLIVRYFLHIYQHITKNLKEAWFTKSWNCIHCHFVKISAPKFPPIVHASFKGFLIIERPLYLNQDSVARLEQFRKCLKP